MIRQAHKVSKQAATKDKKKKCYVLEFGHVMGKLYSYFIVQCAWFCGAGFSTSLDKVTEVLFINSFVLPRHILKVPDYCQHLNRKRGEVLTRGRPTVH